MKFLDLKYEAFGLDINDFSMKVVKLRKKHKGFALSSYNEVKIAPGIIEGGVIKKEEALAKIIRFACDTVKGKKLKTKYVIASLPEEKSFLQVIKMPQMDSEELKLALPLEAENYIPLPIDEVYLDFQVIEKEKKDSNGLEVLIVAMPRKIVDSYVSCFKKAGLEPIILEAESEATARALIKKEADSLLTILIDFGENNTDFIVFSKGSVRFTCAIPVSSQLLTKAISESMKVSFNEAEKLKIEYGLTGGKTNSKADKILSAMAPVLDDLIKEIEKYIDFYRDHSSYEHPYADRGIEKILLCGGGSELKGLSSFVSKHLDIPTEVGNQFVNFSIKKQKNANGGLIYLATAIGLALRESDNNL